MVTPSTLELGAWQDGRELWTLSIDLDAARRRYTTRAGTRAEPLRDEALTAVRDALGAASLRDGLVLSEPVPAGEVAWRLRAAHAGRETARIDDAMTSFDEAPWGRLAGVLQDLAMQAGNAMVADARADLLSQLDRGTSRSRGESLPVIGVAEVAPDGISPPTLVVFGRLAPGRSTELAAAVERDRGVPVEVVSIDEVEGLAGAGGAIECANSGTLAAVVNHDEKHGRCALTAAHVGVDLRSPARTDAYVDGTRIGTVVAWTAPADSWLDADAALVKLEDHVTVDLAQGGTTVVRERIDAEGLGKLVKGTPVAKVGRETGERFGRLEYVKVEIRNVPLPVPGGEHHHLHVRGHLGIVRYFSDESFAEPGDSGALVSLLDDGLALGLVCCRLRDADHPDRWIVVVSPWPAIERQLKSALPLVTSEEVGT